MYNQGASITVEREKYKDSDFSDIYSHVYLNKDGREVIPLQLLKTHGFKLLKEWTYNRDQEVFDLLYYSTFKILMKKASGFVEDYDDAVSIVHDAFYKAGRVVSKGKLKNEDNFLAYICRIVENEAKNLFRKNKRDPQYIGGLSLDEVTGDSRSTPSELEGHGIPDYSTVDNLDEKMGMEIVEQLLPSIAETRRDVFRLMYIDGFSVKETVRITGKSLGTVLSQSKRSRDDLRKNILSINSQKIGLEEMVNYYTR